MQLSCQCSVVHIALTSERWCAHTVFRSVFGQWDILANNKIGSYISCNKAYYEMESVGPKEVRQLLSDGCKSNGRISILFLKVITFTFWCFSCASGNAADCWGRWAAPLWPEWQSPFLGFNVLLLFSGKFGGKPPWMVYFNLWLLLHHVWLWRSKQNVPFTSSWQKFIRVVTNMPFLTLDFTGFFCYFERFKFELSNLNSYPVPNLIYPAEDKSTVSCHLSSKALEIVQKGFKQLQELLYSFLC